LVWVSGSFSDEIQFGLPERSVRLQRRALTKPPTEGGWKLFCTGFSKLDWFTPASHLALRGNGKNAWFGWPTLPKLEELREARFNAPNLAAQKKIGMEIQQQAFDDVPYYPLGLAQQTTAFGQNITGVPEGFAIFWNARRS
jgi:peptide/nickel transport system substrate-binding protein